MASRSVRAGRQTPMKKPLRPPLDLLRGVLARHLARRAEHVVGLEVRSGRPYRVARAYPHDPCAFTQGLVWDDGMLLESTGLAGRSTLRRVELASGRVVAVRRVRDDVFAEGIAMLDTRIVQLTWRSGVGFVYDREGLDVLGEFAIDGEGWGLAFDGERLIMSDGSATLRFLDPDTLKGVGELEVRDGGAPVVALNDLQVVGDGVWANVWQTPRLARISLATGGVTDWLDLSPLCSLPENRGRGNTLNGVTHDPGRNRLLVTGKRWPRIFEIELLG